MYTRNRNALCIIVVMVLFASFTSIAFAQRPTISVTPATSNIQLGQAVTINITATNIGAPSLYSYELKLIYNTTLLNGTSCQIPTDQFLKPSLDPGNIFTVRSTVNQTEGIVELAVTLLMDEPGKTGSGTLGTVSFTGLAMGTATLQLEDVVLVDPDTNPWPDGSFDVVDGSIQIIPEFTLAILIAAFMMMSAAAILMRKRLR